MNSTCCNTDQEGQNVTEIEEFHIDGENHLSYWLHVDMVYSIAPLIWSVGACGVDPCSGAALEGAPTYQSDIGVEKLKSRQFSNNETLSFSLETTVKQIFEFDLKVTTNRPPSFDSFTESEVTLIPNTESYTLQSSEVLEFDLKHTNTEVTTSIPQEIELTTTEYPLTSDNSVTRLSEVFIFNLSNADTFHSTTFVNSNSDLIVTSLPEILEFSSFSGETEKIIIDTTVEPTILMSQTHEIIEFNFKTEITTVTDDSLQDTIDSITTTEEPGDELVDGLSTTLSHTTVKSETFSLSENLVTHVKSEIQSSHGEPDMSEVPTPDAKKPSDKTETQILTFDLTPDPEITTRPQKIIFHFTRPQEEVDSDYLVFDLTQDKGH